jgi:two-component system nitrate/nitrite response regulator NarL
MDRSVRASVSIRIFLLDGRPLRRAALKCLLQHQADMDVVADAEDDPAIAALAHLISFDVVLISSNDVGRVDATLAALAHAVPAPRVVWLTDQLASDIGERVVEGGLVDRGLVGMVDEEDGVDGLVQTIEQVHAGAASLGPDATARALVRLLRKSAGEQKHESVRLTRREREVIALLGRAQTNKQIADALFISHATVRNHLTSIFRKLELSSRLELLVYAFEHGLIDDAIVSREAARQAGEPPSPPVPEWSPDNDPLAKPVT